jgi:hypothetical protein
MIGISYITAVTDDHLVMTAAVAGIMVPVVSIAKPWVTVINHNLVPIVNVVIAIPYWQIPAVYPYVVFIINIIVGWYIIVSINIGHVIIVYIIIPYWSPIRLAAYVNTQANANLSRCYFCSEAA